MPAFAEGRTHDVRHTRNLPIRSLAKHKSDAKLSRVDATEAVAGRVSGRLQEPESAAAAARLDWLRCWAVLVFDRDRGLRLPAWRRWSGRGGRPRPEPACGLPRPFRRGSRRPVPPRAGDARSRSDPRARSSALIAIVAFAHLPWRARLRPRGVRADLRHGVSPGAVRAAAVARAHARGADGGERLGVDDRHRSARSPGRRSAVSCSPAWGVGAAFTLDGGDLSVVGDCMVARLDVSARTGGGVRRRGGVARRMSGFARRLPRRSQRRRGLRVIVLLFAAQTVRRRRDGRAGRRRRAAAALARKRWGGLALLAPAASAASSVPPSRSRSSAGSASRPTSASGCCSGALPFLVLGIWPNTIVALVMLGVLGIGNTLVDVSGSHPAPAQYRRSACARGCSACSRARRPARSGWARSSRRC